MRLAIDFDLTNDKVIVEWPWQRQAFPYTDEGIKNLTEALKNFAIFSTAVIGKQTVSRPQDWKAVREAMERGGVKPQHFNEDGSAKLPSLDNLFDEEDFAI